MNRIARWFGWKFVWVQDHDGEVYKTFLFGWIRNDYRPTRTARISSYRVVGCCYSYGDFEMIERPTQAEIDELRASASQLPVESDLEHSWMVK